MRFNSKKRLILWGRLLAVVALALLLAAPAAAWKQSGKASYYADKFVGRTTANGETFSQKKLTAAHKTLKFGTRVKVKNRKNGRTVAVRINDRGPFVKGRVIDLSKAAAKKLGMLRSGVVPVVIAKIN